MPYPDGTETLGNIPLSAQFFDRGGVVYNVMHPDFGAKGDGINDDGAAINSAITTVGSNDGGVIVFPPGTYDLVTAVSFGSETEITLWILPGVTFTTGTLPDPTGTNKIVDWSSFGIDIRFEGTCLVLDQGADDENIVLLKSSDVAHGLTSFAPTDCFGALKKNIDGDGGLFIRSFSENGASGGMTLTSIGGTANTTKTSSGTALVTVSVFEQDGLGSIDNITADGNVFAIKGRVGGSTRTLFLVDEDGDIHYDGADQGSFDRYDDIGLVRTLMHATSREGIIKTQWDRLVKYKEDDLVSVGVLGAPVSEGGLVNLTQTQRLLMGTLWQQQIQINELKQALGLRLNKPTGLLSKIISWLKRRWF